MIHLAIASDRHLVDQAGVTALSAVRSCSAPIHVTFLTPSVDLHHPTWQTVLNLLMSQGARADLLPVDFDLFNRQLAAHLTPTTYYRLLLPKVLAPEIDRVIYLDCDVLVERDLKQLWSTSLDGAALAAVADPNFVSWSTLGIDASSGYFNAGVLLLDLASIRASRAFPAVLDFALQHPEALTWADQCALNKIFVGHWKELGKEWNYQHAAFLLDVGAFGMRRAKEMASRSVIHFNNYDRPWLCESAHPMKPAYFSICRAYPQLSVTSPGTPAKYWKRFKRTVKWQLITFSGWFNRRRGKSTGPHSHSSAPRIARTSAPIVSVVMPVFNGQRFLSEAVHSILEQTLSDLELIVVDDGSSDQTPAMLAEYERRDQRVRIHRHPQNRGISATRNTGCQMARGRFIAVMDADDVSLPHRLATQVAFLEAHPDVAAVGAWVQRFDETGKRARFFGPNHPQQPALVAWSMLFFNSVAHSTLMFRREAVNLESVYDCDYPVAEDYNLLMELSQKARVANIAEVLVLYRTWSGSISRNSRLQEHANRVVQSSLARMGVTISREQAASLQGLSRDSFPEAPDQIRGLAEIIRQLRLTFRERIFSTAEDRQVIDRDCAMKLWLLAALAAPRSPVLAGSLAGSASRIRPLSFLPFAAKVAARLASTAQTKLARSPA